MNKIFCLALVFVGHFAFAESPINTDQVTFKALMANAATMNVVGDIEADKLSDVIAEALLLDQETVLNVSNQCEFNSSDSLWNCRLNINSSDSYGESSVIIQYQLEQNEKGEFSPAFYTAQVTLAG